MPPFIGMAIVLGIIGGIGIDTAQRTVGATIVYAREPEAPRVILIGTTTAEKSIEQKIRDTFPEDPETALKIAKCESNFIPTAKSPTNDHGLMQINLTVHSERVEEMGIDVYDIDDNLRFARLLYDESKWVPWVCKKLI
jgi:soluble lytic murein transglycosylase-like protein